MARRPRKRARRRDSQDSHPKSGEKRHESAAKRYHPRSAVSHRTRVKPLRLVGREVRTYLLKNGCSQRIENSPLAPAERAAPTLQTRSAPSRKIQNSRAEPEDLEGRPVASAKICAFPRSRAPSLPSTAGGDPRQKFGAPGKPGFSRNKADTASSGAGPGTPTPRGSLPNSLGNLFLSTPRVWSPSQDPPARSGPGLPHHRHKDDQLYLGLFWLVLIACATYIGYVYL